MGKKNKILGIAIASLLFSFSTASFAVGSKTATNKATATLASGCSLTMGNLSFGNVIPGQASSTTTNTLSVTCSNGLAYTFNTTHPSDGVDCPNLVGAAKGQKLYYLMDYQGTFLANLPANKISRVGTGTVQNYTIEGKINPISTGLNCEAPQNNPGANNINPYVAPDNYSTTANMVIAF